jgi:hypothetical protein
MVVQEDDECKEHPGVHFFWHNTFTVLYLLELEHPDLGYIVSPQTILEDIIWEGHIHSQMVVQEDEECKEHPGVHFSGATLLQYSTYTV